MFNPLALRTSVSARARFVRFDPVNSSVDATEVSQCVLCDATKLPLLKCLKNLVNTQLSLKSDWDISVLKYIHRYEGISKSFEPNMERARNLDLFCFIFQRSPLPTPHTCPI